MLLGRAAHLPPAVGRRHGLARVLSSKASPPQRGDVNSSERLPRVVGEDAVFENPWLRLKSIRFLDQQGRERKWTGIERTTTYPMLGSCSQPQPVAATNGDDAAVTVASHTVQEDDEKCDAVVVFPFLTQANTVPQVILIRQFRPPVGKWVVELPAGLIDGDEDPHVAAFRELHEETGYVGSSVLHMGPPMVNDQGITNGKCRLLLMQVRHEDQQAAIEQHLEDDEMIQVLLAPLDGLIPWLLERKATAGDAIDARLYSYALGLQAVPLDIRTKLN